MVEIKRQREIRILVADDELILRDRLVEHLKEQGFLVKAARNASEVKALLAWKPHFILYDLMLPDLNALEFLKYARSMGLIGEDRMRVFVMSGHNNPANIKECMRSGATDFVPKPLSHSDLLARLVIHIQEKREVRDPSRLDSDYDRAQYFIHLTELTLREALKGAPPEECLHSIMKMTAMALKAVRVSIVKCDSDVRKGYVIASNDNPEINRLAIELGKYPEILFVLRTNKMLALDNLATDPSMHFVTRQEKQIKFNSMIVSPIRIAGEIWGVLSVRLPDSKERLAEHEIRFAQLVANVAGLVIIRDPVIASTLLAPADSAEGSGPSSKAS